MERFSRQEMLFGSGAMERLRQARVLVCGLGGVGSFAAEALCRAGVGKLALLDFDRVDRSNINRQLIALESTVGRSKTEVCAARLRDINPDAVITELPFFFGEENADQVFAERPDYVIDAIDTVGPKVALITACHERGIPCISALGTGNKLDPSRFEIADIYDTTVCPLARVMRRELRRRGVARHQVLYSREVPLVPRTADGQEDRPGRHTPGSVSFTPPVAGLLLARHVILALADPWEE